MAKGRERCEMKSGNVIGCGDISIKTNSYSHRGNELFKIPFLEFTEAFRYQFGRANKWKGKVAEARRVALRLTNGANVARSLMIKEMCR